MSVEPITFRAGYMDEAHQSTAELVADAEFYLEDVDYDTMVGTGFSGALVVPKLAEALGKHWLLVRKPKDGSHSSYPAEGSLGRRWLFVDDVIATGETRDRVRYEINKQCKLREYKSTFVGTYLYANYGDPEFRRSSSR